MTILTRMACSSRPTAAPCDPQSTILSHLELLSPALQSPKPPIHDIQLQAPAESTITPQAPSCACCRPGPSRSGDAAPSKVHYSRFDNASVIEPRVFLAS